MEQVILLNKKEGETPLEALEVFRRKHKRYKDVKLTYAGRLDPMASGVMIVLSGAMVYEKEKYLQLDKEYEFEVLFGFATDTYDVLGKITKCVRRYPAKDELENKIKENLKYFTGKFAQEYPMYSSKTLLGKQLFEYAREGIDVEVPKREVNVKNLKLVKIRKVSSKKLLEDIEKRVKKVNGDFRQEEILKIWRDELRHEKLPEQFFVASFKIKCGSGTYVRSIANSLGERLKIPALAYKIVRTKIGKFVI